MIETRAASEQSQLAQTLQDQQRELLAKIDLSVGMKAGSIAAADSQQNGAKLASTSSLETKDDQLDLAASYAVGIATGSLLIPLFKWLV